MHVPSGNVILNNAIWLLWLQAWECYSPPQSPSRAILEDLPQFSMSPLPYITEVAHCVFVVPT